MRVIDTFRTVLSLAYSPCGRFVYSAGWQHVSRWDVNDGEEHSVFYDPAVTYLMNITASPCGKRIAWQDLARQHTTFWELAAPFTVRRGYDTRVTLNGQPTHLFLHDGTPVRCAGPVATDQESSSAAFVHSGRFHYAPLPADGPSGRRDSVPELTRILGKNLVEVLPGQPHRFAFASCDLLWWQQGNGFFLRDTSTGEERQLEQLDRPPLAVTPDGRTGIATDRREVLLIDLPSGLTRERYNWDVGTVEAVAVAPDGLTAAVAGWAGGIAIFDLDG